MIEVAYDAPSKPPINWTVKTESDYVWIGDRLMCRTYTEETTTFENGLVLETSNETWTEAGRTDFKSVPVIFSSLPLSNFINLASPYTSNEPQNEPKSAMWDGNVLS
jgi:hypothetical protein